MSLKKDNQSGDVFNISGIGDNTHITAGRNAKSIHLNFSVDDLIKPFTKKKPVQTKEPVKIFVSSTWKDLQPERNAVEKVIQRMNNTAFVGMEYFGSRTDTTKKVSLDEVDNSQIYLGIFGYRYGSGITEDEYKRAKKSNLPCLIYIKEDGISVDPKFIEKKKKKQKELDRLKQELKENHTVIFFKDPKELATNVASDLYNLITKDFT